ncbi:MAG: AmpG family muropeptide MFS transporter [Methylococcales bacterium]|nr:AmpG family muropeptide MFS transporter [Methylococcales bacterium]
MSQPKHALLAIYLQPRVLGMAALGFSAGLPFLLVFSTLSAWLRDSGIELSVIGFFSWVGLTYSIKVIWAPVVDHLPLPMLTAWLGKRRAWLLLAQIGIALGLLAMAMIEPRQSLALLAALAVWVAFCSATQDVALDAYRIEAVAIRWQAAMAAMYVFGYRVALLTAGAGAFFLAEWQTWAFAYQAMAALMAVGMLTTLFIAEPVHVESVRSEQAGLWHIVVAPFLEFFRREGRLAWVILLLIAVYRLSDITMGVMANPFYLDMGYSKAEIAEIGKVFGFLMTLLGASLGGVLVLRFGLAGPLWLGALLTASTNLLFAWLAGQAPDWVKLAWVISADNFGGGLAGSVFIAYLSSLTSSAFTATQYALFSSLMTLPAKLLGGVSGMIVERFGYSWFFVYSALLGVPALALVVWVMQRRKPIPADSP